MDLTRRKILATGTAATAMGAVRRLFSQADWERSKCHVLLRKGSRSHSL
jgi:hypothetical protein